MQTGIKLLDNLLTKFGITPCVGSDAFQTVVCLHGGDERVARLALPYCFARLISHAPVSQRFYLHQFYLPHRKARLASYLLNESGELVEQVFYQQDARNKKASRKIALFTVQAYRNHLHQLAA